MIVLAATLGALTTLGALATGADSSGAGPVVTGTAGAGTLGAGAEPAAIEPANPVRTVFRADMVYTAAGDPIAGGFVAVNGAKIAGVGPGAGDGGDVFQAAAITPGLIDLDPNLNLGRRSVDETSEVQAGLEITDAVDLFSYRWGRELAGGVTAVLAKPDDRDVVGGRAAMLKTGGEPGLAQRLVPGRAILRGAFGSSPSSSNRPAFGRPTSIYNRRPTTRMGVAWEWRKAFYDTLAGRGDETRAFPGSDVLDSVLRGETALSVHAGATQDIRTAIYLKEEFNIPLMWVDAAGEAYREPDLLVRSGMAVVLPPFQWNGRTSRDNAFCPWDSAKQLADLGVTFALSGQGTSNRGERLAYQPGLAMRGGLSFDAALAAVTITPARMAGVDARIGSLEVGKDADFVLWSAEPFQPTSRILGVVLDGELVIDNRPTTGE